MNRNDVTELIVSRKLNARPRHRSAGP